MNQIPANIKSKVIDLDWSKTFKFEDIPCEHKPTAKAFEKVDCKKCN